MYLVRCKRPPFTVLVVSLAVAGLLLFCYCLRGSPPLHDYISHYMMAREQSFVRQSSNWMKGHFDATGRYKILPYVALGERWAELSQGEGAVCAGVQTSLDRAAWLPRFVSSWPSALSLALFAPGPEFPLALSYVRYLRHCYPAIREQVTFHLVHDTEWPPSPDIEVTLADEVMSRWCLSSTPRKVLATLTALQANSSMEWRTSIEYPQNVLRNVARDHCQTYWVTTPDIDMLFPRKRAKIVPSIYQRVSTFLTSPFAKDCQLCAYVLPVYEIEENSSHIPSDKTELIEYVKNNKSRQYHIKVFKNNQELSKLNYWEKIKSNDSTVQAVYKVKKFRFWYEPVYIAKRGTPRFDERYVGYGMVRNTQVYEMHLAGYTFHVLDNVFLSHWGFQKAGQNSAERSNQTFRNKQLFCQTHLYELQARYHNKHYPADLYCES